MPTTWWSPPTTRKRYSGALPTSGASLNAGTDVVSRDSDSSREAAGGTAKTQQEPIIEEAGVVDSIRVDHHGAYHSAQFDEMVPIPAVL